MYNLSNLILRKDKRIFFYNHRNKLLQLTAGLGFSIEVKGGPVKIVNFQGNFFVTSNEEPPVFDEFTRRFHYITYNEDMRTWNIVY